MGLRQAAAPVAPHGPRHRTRSPSGPQSGGVQAIDGSWIVASGFGPRADWYRNLRAAPKTVIQAGNHHRAVTAHFLTPDDGAEIMADYAQRQPRTAQRLCTFMGLPSDGSEAGSREVGRNIPFIRLNADTDPRLP